MAPPEVLLANMYFSVDQTALGRESLEKAAVSYPTDPEPHLIFGDIALREGRLSDALALYEVGGRLLKSYSGPSDRKRQLTYRTLVGLASVAENRGNFEDALKRWEAASKADPKNANAHFRLGIVLFNAGKPEESLAQLKEAARLEPNAPSPQLTMVALCRQTGELDEAERWLIAAIKEKPDNLENLIAMARWQLEVRNAAYAAEEYAERARKIDPKSLEVELLDGMIAWHQGELGVAEKHFEAAYLREPQNAMAISCLSGVLAEQRDKKKQARAWELAKLAVADSNQSPDAIAALGWAAYHLGQYTEAQKYLHTAISKGAGRDASYYLARAAYRDGHLAHAKFALTKALKGSGLFIHLKDAKKWDQVISTLEDLQ
ncbi:MAG: tetratricopeptide repeat protein [Planctomycetales bacterium]|nr:tetratricopeptide repeat protein [Planctomycetales bacterium]